MKKFYPLLGIVAILLVALVGINLDDKFVSKLQAQTNTSIVYVTVDPTGNVCQARDALIQFVPTGVLFPCVSGTRQKPPSSGGPPTGAAGGALTGTYPNPTIGSTPTIPVAVIVPLVVGGTATTSPLTLRSTGGVGAAGADIIFQTGNNGGVEVARFLNDGSVNLAGVGAFSPTGVFKIATPLATPGTTPTLVAPRGYAVCTGTCTVTVPVPAAGYEFCIVNDDNVATAITLSALGSSAQYENSARTAYGTAGTGTLVVAAASANKVCIVGRDATHYFTVSNAGGAITVN